MRRTISKRQKHNITAVYNKLHCMWEKYLL